MKEGNVYINVGIGFFQLLTIAFIILKLLEKIDWHWAWVFAPIWAPPVAAIALFIIAFSVAFIIDMIQRNRY